MNKSNLEFKKHARKRQKQQLLIGIALFFLFIYVAMKFSPAPNSQVSDGIIFTIIMFSLFIMSLLFAGTSLFNLLNHNYSYIRISDVIIVCINVLKFVIAFGFVGLCAGLLTIVRGKTMIMLMTFLIVIVGNALFLFILNDSFFRKIYFKIVKKFNLDDSDFDKSSDEKAAVAYDIYKKKNIYGKTKLNNGHVSYSSNSFDSFRHGFSSDITFFGFPLNKELLSFSKKYKRLKKEIGCSKLKRKIEYEIDENNNFRYKQVYYCSENEFSNLEKEQVKKACSFCPKYKLKKIS